MSCLLTGSTKAKKISDLLKYDVVLTTYQTMALEWPDYEAEEKAKKKKAKKNDFIETDSDDNRKSKKKTKQRTSLHLITAHFSSLTFAPQEDCCFKQR